MSIAGIGASVAGAAVGGLFGKKGSDSRSSHTSQTTQTIPWDVLAPYLEQMYAQTGGLMGGQPPQLAGSAPIPEYYPGQTTTAYDPAAQTLQGFQGALNFASNYLPGMTDAGLGSIYSMMGAADVANNPYVQGMNQATARDITRSGTQQIGDLGMMLGNQLQNFGLTAGQAASDAARTLGNANQDFGMGAQQAAQRYGLTSEQAANQFGLNSQFATENLGRTLGNATQDFGLAARQATGDQERALQGLLGDFRSNYRETASDLQRQLQREILPEIEAGAGLSGGYGGTRHGVAQGVAMGDLAEALSDYGRGFDTQFEQAYGSGAETLRDTISNLGRDVSQGQQAGAMGTSQTIRGLGENASDLIANLGLNTSQLTSNLGRDVSQAQQAAAMGLRDLNTNLGRDYSQQQMAGARTLRDTISNLGRDYSQQQMAGARTMGNTISNLGDTLGSALAQTNLGAYGQGLGAQQAATSMLPTIANLGMMAPSIYMGVGNAIDALGQQVIDAEKQRWDYGQNAGLASFLDTENRAMQNWQNSWLPVQNANSIYGNSPYRTTNQQNQGASNPTAGMLGGAMAGWNLGGQFGNWLGGNSTMNNAASWAMNPGTNVQANPAFTTWGGGLYPTF